MAPCSGFIFGHFCCHFDSAGVVSTHAPAPEVEGGQWTFAFLGKDFCVKVTCDL
jgi:hypothetical protein